MIFYQYHKKDRFAVWLDITVIQNHQYDDVAISINFIPKLRLLGFLALDSILRPRQLHRTDIFRDALRAGHLYDHHRITKANEKIPCQV